MVPPDAGPTFQLCVQSPMRGKVARARRLFELAQLARKIGAAAINRLRVKGAQRTWFMARLKLALVSPDARSARLAGLGLGNVESRHDLVDTVTCHQDHQDAVHITAILGESVVFNCQVDFPEDIPVPYVLQWEKKGQDIPIYIWYESYPTHSGEGYEGRVSRVAPDSPYGAASLNLTNIRETDQGWYECKVVFLNRSPNQHKNGTWFHLDVHAPPRFSITPEDIIYVNLGDAIILNCQAEGTPTPEILWYKDANPVEPSGTVGIFNDGTELRISNIRHEDIGDYTCIARNGEGQVSHTARVIIAGGAVITALPGNVTVKWFREGAPVAEVAALETRVTIRRDGALVINPVAADDSGQYLCEVSNGIGEPQSASAYLNVEYPAKVTFTPTVQYLPFRLAGVVQCYIKANPPLQYVTWTKDKRLLEPYQTKDIVIMNNGSLLFTRVNQNHQGRYTCTPYNAQGTQGSSGPMEVLVRKPPAFTVEPEPLYQRKEAEGTQRPSVAWRRRDGLPLQKNRVRALGGNITIDTLRRQDFGIYQCLVIEGTQPHAPYNVSGTATEFQVTLRWQPGYAGGPDYKQDYTIWYREAGFSEWTKVPVTPSGATSPLVIEGTQPHAPYNVSGTATEFQVTLRWQPGYAGGPDYKQDYTIWYREAGFSEWTKVPVTPSGATSVSKAASDRRHAAARAVQRVRHGHRVPGDAPVAARLRGRPGLQAGLHHLVPRSRLLRVTINRLQPGTTYEFQVNSKNTIGEGMMSKAITIRTLDVGAKQKPAPTPTGLPNDKDFPEPPESTVGPPAQPVGGGGAQWVPDHVAVTAGARRPRAVLHHQVPHRRANLVGGRTYYFRVLANSATSYESSDEVKYPVPARVKHKAITAGVVGGILFFIVAIILSVCAVKICNKRKRRKQEKAYNMVAARLTDLRAADSTQVPFKKFSERGISSIVQCLRFTANWVWPASRRNSQAEMLTVPDNDKEIKSQYFNSSNKMKVITHGWLSAETTEWLQKMKSSFLKKKDYNIILVDWSELADNPIYPWSAFSTRYVGKRVAKLLAALKRSDAAFVDIIHTCGGIYGYRNSHGHADFYPNDGRARQPGCDGAQEIIEGCSHGRSYEFFDESINSEIPFLAYPCESWDKFDNGECKDNPTAMGYPAADDHLGDHYLYTRAQPKYAIDDES
ncbi:Protein turtle [Operophtera brumata]|uniref:Protein turtle n=1 Tax=Operophtera brumata TaxID=104452 RepID=A0A0L7LDJ8_OPEBR|nr:Protein turtle [Operophtera brumata]